jgi:hypothetical protein
VHCFISLSCVFLTLFTIPLHYYFCSTQSNTSVINFLVLLASLVGSLIAIYTAALRTFENIFQMQPPSRTTLPTSFFSDETLPNLGDTDAPSNQPAALEMQQYIATLHRKLDEANAARDQSIADLRRGMSQLAELVPGAAQELDHSFARQNDAHGRRPEAIELAIMSPLAVIQHPSIPHATFAPQSHTQLTSSGGYGKMQDE